MWPWNRQGTTGARLLELEQGLAKLQADVRAALREVSEISERAYKHLKRAEQRARRELDESGTAGSGEATTVGPVATAVTPSSSQRAWGARGRRLQRSLRAAPTINGEADS